MNDLYVVIVLVSALVALAAGSVAIVAVARTHHRCRLGGFVIPLAVALGVFAVGAAAAWLVDPPEPAAATCAEGSR